jgi:hypothetical protein
MRILSSLAVVAVVATAPLASHAQSRPGDDHNTHNHPDKAQAAPAAPGGMSRMMAMMHGGMMGGGMMGDMPLKHVEGRLAFLKTELKITSAQEPQWARFADVVRSTAKNAETAKPPMMQGGMKPSTAPDRLGQYEKTLAVRLETVRVLKTAVDPLYASFSDEQKKLADELLMSPMGIM